MLEAFDAITHVTGSALTYAPNPVQQTGNTNLRDNADADDASLTAARAAVTLTDLTTGTDLLRGTYADAASSAVSGCTLPYVPGQATSATRAYDYTRSQDAFEETAAYDAITRVQRSYVDFGFPTIFSGPVPIDVHCITDDNSYFSTSDDALHMGDGGVDDAEDSDVTVHELGHATQAAQVPGFGPGSDTEQRAMGEGFGDFLATFTYLQTGDPTYQAARRFCVMEWDATSYNPVVGADDGSGCLRWVDGTNESNGSDIGTYGGTPDEEHDDGRYWSAMLTCVFNGIEPTLGTSVARTRMLTLVLAHHFDLVPTSANVAFEDSLTALRAEDSARFGGAETALINSCGEQRLGIIAPDTTAPEVNGTLTPAAPNGANGWYRSAPAVDWTVSDAESAVATTGCQDGTDPADTTGRTITCTATSDGGVTSKSLSYKKDSTPPSLAAALSSSTATVGQALTAAPNAADATSGVAAQSCGTPDTSSAGTHTVSCSATDTAGNQATQTLTYAVAAAPGPGPASDPPGRHQPDVQGVQGEGVLARNRVVPLGRQRVRQDHDPRQGRQGGVPRAQREADRREGQDGHAQAVQEGTQGVQEQAARREEGQRQDHRHSGAGQEADVHAEGPSLDAQRLRSAGRAPAEPSRRRPLGRRSRSPTKVHATSGRGLRVAGTGTAGGSGPPCRRESGGKRIP